MKSGCWERTRERTPQQSVGDDLFPHSHSLLRTRKNVWVKRDKSNF